MGSSLLRGLRRVPGNRVYSSENLAFRGIVDGFRGPKTPQSDAQTLGFGTHFFGFQEDHSTGSIATVLPPF